MGWSVGWDPEWQRDIGYGVPSICDHSACSEEIHRGLAYVCGGDPFGGDHGCGLYFCADHLWLAPVDDNDDPEGFRYVQMCERCSQEETKPYPFTPTADTPEWMRWKLTDDSWTVWRYQNPGKVKALREALEWVDGDE